MFDLLPQEPVPDAAKPVAPLDEALAKAALQTIQKLVAGNGINPKNVILEQAEGGVYQFFGATFVSIAPVISQSKKAGKNVVGELIDPNKLDHAIDTHMQRMATDHGVIKHITMQLEARADKGFGVEPTTAIELKGYDKAFSFLEACISCRGDGNRVCEMCNGESTLYCVRCHGKGLDACGWCYGRGQIATPQGDQPCQNCHGRGQAPCVQCNGKGRTQCVECNGHGRKNCDTCGGQGWTTYTTQLNVKLVPDPLIDLDNVHDEVKIALSRIPPPALAASGDLQVSVLSEMDSRPLRQVLAPRTPPVTGLYYKAQMPVARLAFKLGKTYLKPLLVGYHGRITDCPPFLDRLLSPAVQALQNAAKGGADAADDLKKALNYKLIRLVVEGLSRTKPKKVLQVCQKNYPLGLSEKCLKACVHLTHAALNKLSFWPNLKGIGLAVLVCAGIGVGYRFLIASTLAAALPSVPRYGLDIAVYASLLAMHIGIARFAARKFLKHLLVKLNLQAFKLGLPAIGWLNYVGLLALLVFFLILYLRPFNTVLL